MSQFFATLLFALTVLIRKEAHKSCPTKKEFVISRSAGLGSKKALDTNNFF